MIEVLTIAIPGNTGIGSGLVRASPSEWVLYPEKLVLHKGQQA